MITKRSGDNPIDAEVGSETDVEATAQAISSAVIQAEAVSERPIGERHANLLAMKADLESRLSTKPGHDLLPLVQEIDMALAQLTR